LAAGEIRLKRETLEAVKNRKIVKGEVLETARIAAVMAVKKTPLPSPCVTYTCNKHRCQVDTGEESITATVEVSSFGKTESNGKRSME